MVRHNRNMLAPLVGIVLIGTALRLFHINHQSIWWDEAISLIISRVPFVQIKDFFKIDSSTATLWLGPNADAYLGPVGVDTNPPLYYYSLHAWFRLFGFGGLQARLFSAVAGVLSLPMMFVVVRRLFDKRTALLGTLFLAVSQLGIAYSQEARTYALTLLLFLCTLYFYLAATSARLLSAWCACTVSAILMIGAHYYGGLAIMALAVYTILYWRQRAIQWQWLVGGALVGVIALSPWYLYALREQLSGAAAQRPAFWFGVNWWTIFDTLNRFNNGAVAGFENEMPRWTFPVGGLLFTLPVIVIVLRSVMRLERSVDVSDRSAVVLCCVLGLLPVLTALFLGWLANVQYHARYVAFCIVPYYSLWAAAVSSIRQVALRRGLVLAMLAYSGCALRANYYVPYKENYREAVAYIAARSASTDCNVFVPFGSPPLGWTIYTQGFPTRLISPRLDRPLPADCPRIWVVTYTKGLESLPMTAQWEPLLKTLRRSHTKTDEQHFYWIDIELYRASIAE